MRLQINTTVRRPAWGVVNGPANPVHEAALLETAMSEFKRDRKAQIRQLLWRSVLFLLVGLAGCQTAPRPGLNITDVQEVQKGSSAKPRDRFTEKERPAVRIAGYSGHEVSLELWEAKRGFLSKTSHRIPAGTTSASEEGIEFRERSGSMQPTRVRRTAMTTMDWIVKLNPLRPGSYEMRLTADDGRRESATFVVEGIGQTGSEVIKR